MVNNKFRVVMLLFIFLTGSVFLTYNVIGAPDEDPNFGKEANDSLSPVLKNPSPADNSVGVDTSPTLSVYVEHYGDAAFIVVFIKYDTEFIIGMDTVNSGETASVKWFGLEHSSTYRWYAKIEDIAQSDNYVFTTKEEPVYVNSAPNPPTNPSPSDVSIDRDISLSLSIDVSDPDGDNITVKFYDSSDNLIDTTYVIGTGTASVTWSDLEYSTTYSWYAIVSDSKEDVTSPVYSFTTKDEPTADNNPPYEPSNPSPSDSAKNIAFSTTLSVHVFDPDDDSLTARFYDFSGNLIGTDSVDGSGTASVTWSGFDYSSTYSWYAKVSDGEFEEQSDVFSFSTKSEPVTIIEYGWIMGTVKIEYNDATIPVNQAKICVYPSGETSPIQCKYTAQNGLYFFSDLEVGSYDVVARRKEWTETKSSIYVNANDAAYANFTIVIDENRYRLEEALEGGNIGGEITVETKDEGVYEHETVIYEEVTFESIELKQGEIFLVVDGDEKSAGKTIILNVESDIIDFNEEYSLEYDGFSINMANNYEDILNPNDDGTLPEYLILTGAEGMQILVSIPHFSQHEIKIYNIADVIEAVGGIGTFITYIIFCAILALLVVGTVYFTDRF